MRRAGLSASAEPLVYIAFKQIYGNFIVIDICNMFAIFDNRVHTYVTGVHCQYT